MGELFHRRESDGFRALPATHGRSQLSCLSVVAEAADIAVLGMRKALIGERLPKLTPKTI